MYTEKVILEAVILTAVVVIALTLYTFWAASRGYDFNFLGPFLFGAILVLMVFGMIQVLWFLNFNVLCHHLMFWLHSYCVLACRFSFHWASYLQWSMVAWLQLYSVATSYMIQTTWSRDTPMMNSFGLLSPYIWTSSTFSCLCSLFSEPLIVEVLVLIGTY